MSEGESKAGSAAITFSELGLAGRGAYRSSRIDTADLLACSRTCRTVPNLAPFVGYRRLGLGKEYLTELLERNFVEGHKRVKSNMRLLRSLRYYLSIS